MTGEPQSTLFDVPNGGVLRSPDDAPAVLAYRVGAVEKKVDVVLERLDTFGQNFITTAALMLILEPVKDRVKELENNEKEREQQKSNVQSQYRLAITIAVLSPVLNIVIAVVLNQGK